MHNRKGGVNEECGGKNKGGKKGEVRGLERGDIVEEEGANREKTGNIKKATEESVEVEEGGNLFIGEGEERWVKHYAAQCY